MLNPLRLILACCTFLTAAAWAKPTLYIIGDSTVRNHTAGQKGWGDPLVAHFDPAGIEVVNRAIGGRSSRTFLTEGRWDAVMANLRAGDFVLMQFGHNDGGPINDDRCRASLKGTGDETEDIIRKTDGKPETVRSYGWYLRKYIADTKEKGATPIVLSPIPRNIWKGGSITRDTDGYSLWARQSAEKEGATFIDFHSLLADRYQPLGKERTTAIFAPGDHTHPAPAGAELNASVLANALLKTDLADHLLATGLWMPRIFGDGMVLQRDKANPLWGKTAPDTLVVASIDGDNVSTKSDEDGNFRIDLPPLPAGGPHVLKVTGAGERTFKDVLVGEVWLCSGQSNMDFTLAKTAKRYFAGVTDWEREVAAADHPRIREFKAEWTMREDPQPEIEGTWTACTPQTAGDFSAVAYFFARELQKELGVPVGLITCAYGASTAEAWISSDKLAGEPALKPLRDAFRTKFIAYRDDPASFEKYGNAMTRWLASDRKGRAPAHPDPLRDQHNPAVLFNGMIAPVIPYGIRGVIWYQGESNGGTRQLYPALQRALVTDWRTRWGLGDFPFLYVQLASHKAVKDQPADSSLATMREAQASTLALPHTGMAVTLDIGDEKDVHPRNKQDVGLRLARLAMYDAYGRKDVIHSGPVFRMSEIEDGRVVLHFDHIADGLVAKDGALRHFAIAGDDRKFVWADAEIEDGDKVIVSSPEVPRPAYVRYAWADNPSSANLRNSAGLPAAPFRTDP
ncbi:GDSL-type esterase/lipase family protein [Luteolibacter flavescens]|uniref:GDSL-type esterase/lipase family protein n=1 Tax=Luteolibacter flavescens TaxID=1859460 RepID=A0ABT3FMY2_9BACT|nr:sialate O-acetylesterase [Luteolibacter flavescens]MCW1884936.1 GDSL-type esterase/lipase family protein [Luteolibacter flavescens]